MGDPKFPVAWRHRPFHVSGATGLWICLTDARLPMDNDYSHAFFRNADTCQTSLKNRVRVKPEKKTWSKERLYHAELFTGVLDRRQALRVCSSGPTIGSCPERPPLAPRSVDGTQAASDLYPAS